MRSIEGFEKVFREVSGHNDILDTLQDFLEWTIAAWSHTIKHKKQYTQQDMENFSLLNREWVLLMNDMLNSKYEWFDAFGQLYESNASKSRRDTKGQFFTPESVVNLQVEIIGTLNPEKKGGAVSDPACGSGRYSIAHHAYTKGGYYYVNEDIDYLCCLMTVMNMLIHGAVGEVIWHDALDPDSFFGAWAVNHDLNKKGVPHIEELKYEDSFLWEVRENRRLQVEKERQDKLDDVCTDKLNKLNNTAQFSLTFDFDEPKDN
ncbi:MAG: N-6 DNA methylase [Dysgonomonas sp.]